MSPALNALERVGATKPIRTNFRGSFALVGYAGVARPTWIAQEKRDGGKGPSEVSVEIPLEPSA